MRCPRDTSELQGKIYEGSVEVDQCPQCAGMFLDKGELEAIQATIEKDHRRTVVESVDSAGAPVEVAHSDERGPVDCMKCGKRMDRRRYGFGSQTVIDECPKGCGLWLDGGEIQELERFYESSQQEIEIPITWRIWAAVRGAMGRSKR
jgi:Zn-finger nucleic acid-binding protein